MEVTKSFFFFSLTDERGLKVHIFGCFFFVVAAQKDFHDYFFPFSFTGSRYGTTSTTRELDR